jgi:opacity protein-like surface antigen
MVVGILGLALSAAQAQQYGSLGGASSRAFDEAVTAPAGGDIVLANCLAVLEPEMPPKKAPGKTIVIPDASGKKSFEKKTVDKKAVVRPTPVPMEEVAEDDLADEYGCGECADGCGDGCADCGSCCRRARYQLYVALSGGSAHRETVHEANDASTFLEFDHGFAVNVALGWRFWDMFRLEAEYTFMNNDVETAGSAGLVSGAAGNVNLRAWMVNLYHDIQICDWCLKPYVGAGIGFYQSEINSLYPDFFTAAGPPMTGVGVNTTSDVTFAYQFRVGFSYPLGCRGEIYSGYRFFNGDELTFSAPPFSVFAPTFHPDGAEMHCLETGVRIGF